MNEEKKPKTRKETIKNLAIIFLIVMLLLTFFSNTIMNYSLPEVATAYAESGNVTSKVRGSATVEAAEDYNVNVTENHEVESVKVAVGDTVSENQLLFVLSGSAASNDETAIKEAKDTLDSLELEYEKALLAEDPNYALDNLDIQAAKEELDAAIANRTKAQNKSVLEQQVRDKQADVDELQADIDTLQVQVDSVSENTTKVKKLNDKLAKKRTKLATATDELNSLRAQLEATPSIDDAEAAVREKQKALDTLTITLSNKKTEDHVTQSQADLDLAAAKKKVDNQRELVDKMVNGSDQTEVYSKNAGVIKTISCIAGDSVTPDTPLATIAVTQAGYSVSFAVTKEQAKLVKVGQTAQVQNVWDSDMEVTLDQIKADPEAPDKNMMLQFKVLGEDVTVGQTLSLSVGEKSAPYDVIVPNSAIREDNTGKFVLVVSVKSSPLGNRYVLSRADVEVLASDDTNSAVSGGVFGYEYVVTNATKPLEDGMKVRLAE